MNLITISRPDQVRPGPSRLKRAIASYYKAHASRHDDRPKAAFLGNDDLSQECLSLTSAGPNFPNAFEATDGSADGRAIIF